MLRVRGLTVRYGATVALDGVDFEVAGGEIHALVGENGAGKSTLLRVLMAATAPAAGAVERRPGTRLAWAPQEPSLAPDLTAAEWIFLGRERRGPLGFLRRAEMERLAAAALGAIDCPAAARTRLAELSPVERKQVQLARALAGDPELLLLDEPTAALGRAEAGVLFEILRQRRARGASTVYVTHRLAEVRALADRVTVLRDGRRVSTDPVDAVDDAELVRRMVGRDVVARPRGAGGTGDVILRLEGVAVGRVRDASFDLRRGEIVGLAGLVGAGRSEILAAIAGVAAVDRGRIDLRARAELVPEDRSTNGLIPTFGLRENVFLPAPAAWLRPQRERSEAQRWIGELGIRAPGPEAPVEALSGGNQQKVLLARVLRRAPRLLLLDEPTAGVDVGAKAEIHAIIRRLAEGGTAILLASSDLSELLQLSDRILALRAGRIAGELAAAAASEEAVGALITGSGA